ncbi:MAG: UDP-N-acetylglucosamine 4,6-dehydratase (inverting) [Candidatus Marinimicrobia bacterium]|nr:UDP-N-acetylglucosamine 4,6-dehydratase (inverting) [Candidatus Neomarinimicrobiota bacterium]|tara:strand:- start:26303 stop:27319 length:1017 start_codon:yes stop_codon:yes gene_type:complete
MLDNKIILITGGTGSFGKKFTKMTLEKYNTKKIIIFSRDEMKQWNMEEKFQEFDPNGKIDYVIGDVRDKQRLNSVVKGVDCIVHAAATKIVPTAEYNPFECIKTNVNGAMNVIDAAAEYGVEKIVALSTDKACNPINLYGATKLASDKLFVAANLNRSNLNASFSVVRYGNVMGSRGSVIPFFQEKGKSGILPITDERMTRFMITIEEGVKLVWHAIDDALGGEIYVHKIPSMNIKDIAKAICPNAQQKIIGIRPGEKIHEVMINEEDAMCTYEYEWYYKILPTLNKWYLDPGRIKNGIKVHDDFVYSSNNNEKWMSIEELQKYVESSDYKNLQELNI